MIVRRLAQIEGTDAEVDTPNWTSRRLILAGDGVGFSFHDTVIRAGTATEMWYRHHVESVYCTEGVGEIEDRETGEVYEVGPGTLYLLDGHERHELRAHTDLRMMCVFNPPLTGRETHDEQGTYPLLTAD
ncbi:MAG TPA: ectoine synthase [Acidimicrobiales bacterium]|nr:ectoine synthase [Acidimicrobiales bacterium]